MKLLFGLNLLQLVAGAMLGDLVLVSLGLVGSCGFYAYSHFQRAEQQDLTFVA